MTRKKNWLSSLLALGMIVLWGTPLSAQTTYHIGSNHVADGVTYFDTLEDLRLATETQEEDPIYGGMNYHLFNNDTVILYGDDRSLTSELGIADNANVTITSDEEAVRRIIEMAAGTTGPIFNMNYPTAVGSTLNVRSIEMSRGYSPSGGGAVYAWWHNNLYLNNSVFSNNRGSALGGAIYYWDALDSEIVDTDFIDNSTTGAGGAILINASATLSQSNETNVTLRVTENAGIGLDGRPTATFRGNRAGVTWDAEGNVTAGSGYANSIDFTGYTGNRVNFLIDTAEGTLLDMQDPFRTNIGTTIYDEGYTVNLNKIGLGTWGLGGASTIDGSSGTTILIEEGTLELYENAEINAIGVNDSFTVAEGASIYLRGHNTITGTEVVFRPGSRLTFDLGFYAPNYGQTVEKDPMLFLSGDTLVVTGTRIDIAGLEADNPRRFGEYVLIEGANTLDIGDFDLWIGDANIDLSGLLSERYGYSLGYREDDLGNVINDRQLVLTVNETDNTVLRWNPGGVSNDWNVIDDNWTLIRDDSVDSFVPGDTVQFFDSGTHIVNLTEDVLIKHNSVRDASGRQWYDANGDTTGMHVSGDGDWTFTGNRIVDSVSLGRASLLFDGSGSLTLAGDGANNYSYTVLAGIGTLRTANGNQLGTQTVYFRNNNSTAEQSKLHFSDGTRVTSQLVAENGGKGLVTTVNSYGNNLTLTRVADTMEVRGGSVLVKNGGVLEFAADPRSNFGRIIFAENGQKLDSVNILSEGAAVYVENGGALTLTKTDFVGNTAGDKGGAIASAGELAISGNTFSGNRTSNANSLGGALYLFGNQETSLIDSTLTHNYSAGRGGAIHYEAGSRDSTLTIGATAGNTTLIEGNLAGAVYDGTTETWSGSRQGISIAGGTGSTAGIIIDAATGGTVDMRDAMIGATGSYVLEITKTGAGNWKLAGDNQLQSGNSSIAVEEGRLQLAKAATATGVIAGSINMSGGDLVIGASGGLDSFGGNSVNVDRFILENGATLGFDLSHSAVAGGVGDDPLLRVDANSYNFGNGTQKIDILAMSTGATDGYGIYNLALLDTANFDASKMSLLYHGEDMTKFRQHVGVLNTVTDALAGSTLLQIDITDTDNGVTTWTNADGTSVWNGTDLNWEGQGNIAGTEQFLHGDAVIFTDNGAGRVEVNAGGVKIADQDNGTTAGMTVQNSQGRDYTFVGGAITGGAKFDKQGVGSVTFEQENDFSHVAIAGGTVVAKKIGSLGSADVDMRHSGSKLVFDVNNNGDFAGSITGAGRFEKSGSGSLRLTGNNDYSSDTTILGGELVGTSINSFGTGNLIVTGVGEQAGVVTFDINNGQGSQETVTKAITGTGGLKSIGETAIILENRNNYTGGTQIGTIATIIAKDAKSLGTGDIVNDGKLVFDVTEATDGTLVQNITGAGSFYKDGDGILSLGGENDYRGETVVRGGELRIMNENALAGSLVRLEGGNMSFRDLDKILLGGLSSLDGRTELSLTSSKGAAIAMTLQVQAGETVAYHGSLTGKGGVIKTGSGKQIFSGINSYEGGTLIEEGILNVQSTSGLGTGAVVDNAVLEFDLAGHGTFEQAISGTGSVTKSGEGRLTLTGTNTYSGGTYIAAGTLEANSFSALGMGNVTLTHENAAFAINLEKAESFSGGISGAGTFVKDGAGTLYIDGDLLLTGATQVRDGELFLNGNSSSATTIFDGGTLGGNGFLDNRALFKAGAAHRVGHRTTGTLGRFTAKDIAYEGDSTIYIKVGANGSDQVIAKDKINFAQGGGTVDVVFVNLGLDDFQDGANMTKVYEIFVSEGNKLLLDGAAITNQTSDQDILRVEDVDAAIRFIGSAEEGLSVLGYEVKNNADNSKSIFLNLSTFDAGTASYLNGNQKALLRGLGDAELFDRIYGYEKRQRAQLADEMAPMIQTAMPFLTQRAVTQFNLATFERLRFLREPLALAGTGNGDASGMRGQLSHRHGPANYIWFQNFGDILKMSAAKGSPEFQADAYGFSLGFDKGLGSHASIGLGMGGYFSEVNANEVQQSGEANSYLISAYGNWQGRNDWLVAGSTGFVFSSYDLQRRPGPFDTKLSSRHDGTTVFASIEGNKKFSFGRCELSPYAGLDFIWLCEDGYREKADGRYASLALDVNSQDTFTVLSTFGVRLGRAFRLLGGNIVQPSLHAAWVHDWTESDITTTAAFAGMPSFATRGASMHRDRAQLGVNANMTLNRRTDLFAKFNAELAKRYSDLSFHFGFRYGF